MGRVTSLFARRMVEAAGPGIDQKALLASVGLDASAPVDPKQMITDTAYYDLLERIAWTTDVTALPLRAAERLAPDDYGALGLAWKAAPTLRGSFARVERYARLWTSVVEYTCHDTAEGMLFVLHRVGPRRLGMRLSNEATLASSVSISRQVTPRPFAPLRVFLQHAQPADISAHRAFFGCPVQFGADQDALLLSPEALNLPNRLGDEGITQFLLPHLEAELRAVGEDIPLETHIKDAIARALSEGVPKVGDIAQGMGMSARSFHRRLSENGLSFQTLTDATRRELAEGLLREDRYSLAEVAFLTGFSEQSSFTRAFKRWVGATPAHYRKSRTAAGQGAI